MSDSLRLYSTLLTQVRKANPREDLRRQKVFAWAIVGLLLEKTICLPLMANAIVSAAKAASRVRRLQRFLKNTHVCVRAYYAGLIQAALAPWVGQTLYLAIDTVSLAGRLVICRISVIYRGRAVALGWEVYERESVMLAFEDYRDLLDHAYSLLRHHTDVVLMGDRGFRTTDIMAWCDKHPGWHFRLRLKGNQEVTLPDGQSFPLADLRLRPGMVRFLQGVFLGQERYGPINIAMAWAGTPGAEPWYIATDEPADQHTLTEYGWRMDIDESFRDDKSGGFQLEECELPDPPSVSRLLLVMAVACLYLVSLGTFVVETQQRHSVDPHWRRGLSYFQIGWRWLRRSLYVAAVIPGLFRLSPDPDPAPVTLPRAKRSPPVWVEWTPADGGP